MSGTSGAGARAQWLRRGLPPSVAIVMFVVAPFFWTGPLRTVTTLSLPLVLVPALAGTIAVAWLFAPAWRRARDADERRRQRLVVAALLLVAIVSFALLFNRWFGGLMVIVDGDSGTHVATRLRFVADEPGIYFGFVSFYAVTWWFERIVNSAFVGFAFGFYMTVVVWVSAPLLATSAVLAGDLDRRAWRLALGVATIAALLVAYFFALPLLHYHQAEGFFGHVFGLVPLAGIWLCDSYVRPPRLRLAMLAVGVVAYRYTYGLNLADLLIAFAALLVLDARRAFAGWLGRLSCVVVAVVAITAASVGYGRLTPLWTQWGWIIAHDVRGALVAEWLLVAIELLVLVLPQTRRRLRGRGIARCLRLPIAFGAVNASALTWLLVFPRKQPYYVVKYGLHAQLLLAAAIIPLVAALVAGPSAQPAPARSRKDVAVSGVVAVALAIVAALQVKAISVYRPAFLERAFGRPPFRLLHPLADLHAWADIKKILAREHKQFGGYLTTYYPVMNFMNSAFGFPNGGIQFYYGRAPIEAPGYCDFWEGGPPSSWLEGDFPQRARRAAWNADPERQCVSYTEHWDPQRIRTFCWRCR